MKFDSLGKKKSPIFLIISNPYKNRVESYRIL